MNVYKVALFGHREVTSHRKIEERLYPLLQELIRTKPYVEFYIGRNGEFDLLAASIVKRAQKALGNHNNEITLILPYLQKDIEYYEQYYDDVRIPESIENTHPKGAIQKRNRWMVDECDLFLCYVTRECGGAYDALVYARKRGKKIVNLATYGSCENL